MKAKIKSGEEYGLDPYDFDTKEEYLDAVEEEELRALANEEDQVAEVDGVEEGNEIAEDVENAAFSKEALSSVTKVPDSFDCWLGELLREDQVQEAEEALTLLVENPRLADGQLRLLLENTLHYCKKLRGTGDNRAVQGQPVPCFHESCG